MTMAKPESAAKVYRDLMARQRAKLAAMRSQTRFEAQQILKGMLDCGKQAMTGMDTLTSFAKE